VRACVCGVCVWRVCVCVCVCGVGYFLIPEIDFWQNQTPGSFAVSKVGSETGFLDKRLVVYITNHVIHGHANFVGFFNFIKYFWIFQTSQAKN
jgi:hypothetical protein